MINILISCAFSSFLTLRPPVFLFHSCGRLYLKHFYPFFWVPSLSAWYMPSRHLPVPTLLSSLSPSLSLSLSSTPTSPPQTVLLSLSGRGTCSFIPPRPRPRRRRRIAIRSLQWQRGQESPFLPLNLFLALWAESRGREWVIQSKGGLGEGRGGMRRLYSPIPVRCVTCLTWCGQKRPYGSLRLGSLFVSPRGFIPSSHQKGKKIGWIHVISFFLWGGMAVWGGRGGAACMYRFVKGSLREGVGQAKEKYVVCLLSCFLSFFPVSRCLF